MVLAHRLGQRQLRAEAPRQPFDELGGQGFAQG
jgi:hypothetical protein